jgi:arylsulfatase A-like enzyme
VNRVALAWLGDRPGGPFFLFLNYMDTHEPFMPPPEWLDRFPGRRTFLVDPVPAILRGRRELRPEEALHYGALYDGAVAYVDEQIHRLLSQLAQAGRLDDTLVIVTSDHGEFLGEHGLLLHGIGPYDPVHRVPLLIRYPRASSRGIEDAWVGLVDIVPTILSVVGRPATDLDGGTLPRVSHPALIQNAPNAAVEGLAQAQARGYTGLYEGSWKLVDFHDGSRLLFNLDRDPGETRDLSAVEAQRATAMQMRLKVINEKQGRRLPPSLADPDLLERLGAAGYLR